MADRNYVFKVYGTLEVPLAGRSYDTLIALMAERAKTPWSRNSEIEDRHHHGLMGNSRCFDFEGNQNAKAGHVWISRNDKDVAWLTNIIPINERSLTPDEYNDIRDIFAHELVAPAAAELDLELQVSKREVTIDDWIDPESRDALYAFSGSANKSTGSSHPSDKERWDHFICLIHLHKVTFDTDYLQEWLNRDGWDWDRASDLAIEYEQGLSLLSHYDTLR